MTVIKDMGGHAEIVIDTSLISVSQAVAQISASVELKDISVTGESVEETVVSLYKEFNI